MPQLNIMIRPNKHSQWIEFHVPFYR